MNQQRASARSKQKNVSRENLSRENLFDKIKREHLGNTQTTYNMASSSTLLPNNNLHILFFIKELIYA